MTHHIKNILTFTTIIPTLIWLAAAVFSQNALALEVKLSSFKLENGLQVVAIPDRRAPVVTHSIWYRVGSADEDNGKSGLAHFLEHLLFKGTKKFPDGTFDRLLKINGAEGNAFTTRDFTAYYQRAARDRLELLMELEADRMQNLTLTDENVLPELLVVREERRQRTENNPASLLSEQSDAALYTAHPYGRPVIGWMSDVAKLKQQDALDFYRKHYTPANAVVIVAGDIEPHEVRQFAEKHYGPLKNTVAVQPRSRTPEPEAIAARRVAMVDGRAETPYLLRSYLGPSYAGGKSEAIAMDFLASVLGSGSRSRLYRDLVLEQKVAAQTGAWFYGDQLDNGYFSIYAIPNPGVSLSDVEEAIDQVLADVIDKGITQAELDRDRKRALIEQTYKLDDQLNLVRMVGVTVMTGQDVEDAFDTSEWAGVTVEAVTAAAQKYLKPENSVTSTLSRPKEK